MKNALRPPTTRAWYDTLSGVYDRLAEPSERPARLQGLRLLRPRSGERILEIGCGTGHGLVALAHAVGPGGRVAGLDLSEKMLAVAQARVADEGVGAWVDFVSGDARHLPFPDAHFDAVFSTFTLELFNDAEIPSVLAEMGRVLKPGGRVGIVSLAKSDRPTLGSRLYTRMHQWFPRLVDCHPIDTSALLREAGFQISASETFSLWGISGQSVIALTSRTEKFYP